MVLTTRVEKPGEDVKSCHKGRLISLSRVLKTPEIGENRFMGGLTIWAQVFGAALVIGGTLKLFGVFDFDANGVVVIVVGVVLALVGNALKPD